MPCWSSEMLSGVDIECSDEIKTANLGHTYALKLIGPVAYRKGQVKLLLINFVVCASIIALVPPKAND